MRIEDKIARVLKRHKEILFAYLFGSFAKGEQRRESDVDVGIFLRKNFKRDTFYEVQLSLDIEKEAQLRNVEVVVLNGKPPRFLNQVLRYGKLIISTDEKTRINFETVVTKTYIDFMPHYREYDEMRSKRLGL